MKLHKMLSEERRDQYLLRFKALGGMPTLYLGFVFGMAGNLYGNLFSYAMSFYNSTPKRMFMRTVQRVVYMSGSSVFGLAVGLAT